MKKIPADAFDHYFSLGPGRSYQQVRTGNRVVQVGLGMAGSGARFA